MLIRNHPPPLRMKPTTSLARLSGIKRLLGNPASLLQLLAQVRVSPFGSAYIMWSMICVISIACQIFRAILKVLNVLSKLGLYLKSFHIIMYYNLLILLSNYPTKNLLLKEYVYIIISFTKRCPPANHSKKSPNFSAVAGDV